MTVIAEKLYISMATQYVFSAIANYLSRALRVKLLLRFLKKDKVC